MRPQQARAGERRQKNKGGILCERRCGYFWGPAGSPPKSRRGGDRRFPAVSATWWRMKTVLFQLTKPERVLGRPRWARPGGHGRSRGRASRGEPGWRHVDVKVR